MFKIPDSIQKGILDQIWSLIGFAVGLKIDHKMLKFEISDNIQKGILDRCLLVFFSKSRMFKIETIMFEILNNIQRGILKCFHPASLVNLDFARARY